MRLILAVLCSVAMAGPAAADCRAEFANILRHSSSDGPFRIESDEYRSLNPFAAGTEHRRAEIVPPDTADEDTTSTEAKHLGIKVRGGQVWLLNGSTWRMNTAARAAGFYALIVDPVAMTDTPPASVECLGAGKQDGKDVVKYRFATTDDLPGSVSTAYVDRKTGLLVRIDKSLLGVVNFSTTRVSYDPALTLAPVRQPR